MKMISRASSLEITWRDNFFLDPTMLLTYEYCSVEVSVVSARYTKNLHVLNNESDLFANIPNTSG